MHCLHAASSVNDKMSIENTQDSLMIMFFVYVGALSVYVLNSHHEQENMSTRRQLATYYAAVLSVIPGVCKHVRQICVRF